MPIYEEEGRVTRDDLLDLRKRNKCQVCGARLDVFMDFNTNKAFLACADWRRSQHNGIEREPSRYEMEGIAALNIPARREILEKEFGAKMTTKALDKYQGGGQLTKEDAMTILKLVYPKCPETEIIRTAILCRDFGLHPLMKEVYLIPFKNKTGGENYATVIGISANRKIASATKGGFSFLDDSPRAASHAEIVKQFGDNSQEEEDNLISICKLKGERGNLATGFGLWPKRTNPYGTDKGNTQRNMANIRAERQGIDRLPGEAMPFKNLEVIDVGYVDVPEIGKVDKGTGEVIESTARELPGESPPGENEPAVEHWCEEHNCEYERKIRGTSIWYAHKLPDGKWCNELKKKEAVPAPEAEEAPPESVEEHKEELLGFVQKVWLVESLATLKAAGLKDWTDARLLEYMKVSYGVEAATVLDAVSQLDQSKANHFVKRVQDTLDMV